MGTAAGRLLARDARFMSPTLQKSEPRHGLSSLPSYSPEPDFDAQETRRSWVFLGPGLLLSPVFAYLPYLQFFDWFLTSLFHEVGHSFFSWAMGQPAYPAISLTGHAVAVHNDQVFLFAVFVLLGLIWGAWQTRDRPLLCWSLGIAAFLQPIFAFTGAKEALFLAGGHLGELTFAAICFWRTLCGGFTENDVERLLYSVLGWYLVGHNIALCVGLMFSEAAREHYHGSGSFGLMNDYLRLAYEVFETSLPNVAFFMLMTSLIPLPVAIWLWRRGF